MTSKARFPLLLGLLFSLLLNNTGDLSVVLARPQFQYVEPFLYPPYPGTASEESVFDHSSPNYTSTDNRIVIYTGETIWKTCPSPEPPGYPPPQPGVCDIGSGIYWSYALGDWIAYNGHDGIDYGMQYRPLYAAADTNQVVYAGWQDPRNHRYALGLYVKLRHPNGYFTTYGHMSAVAVQSCPAPGCVNLPHGEIIGYSGNTGNSSGPHLHFRVSDPTNRAVDPYGWIGEGPDPWPYNQRNSLWVQYPSTRVYYGGRSLVYPNGDPLPYPTPVTGGVVVDDGSANFSETPSGCFTIVTTSPTQSEGGSMRYVRPVLDAPTCTARWNFPAGLAAGEYAVYIRIPAVHASTEGALYQIFHAGKVKTLTVIQEVFPNPYHVTDGWIYAGRYSFLGTGNEYVALSNQTHDTVEQFASLKVGADAVRFVRIGEVQPTATPSSTFTPSRTRTPSFTFTASRTRTPTFTPTASWTFTPSRTFTPSQTYTSTRTYTPSRTYTFSRTPTYTATPSFTRTPTYTATPSFTRTLTYT
ncbi:MAG: peptidoglycan DD-metalloendopeptidase family protein, partial [Anaerolineales bacterium]|nr:peptidoglycan DD-metalloendopeptidase family protein [Anaerolineales bacterium]